MSFKEYALATRPWSFTAALVPILVTAAVSSKSYTSHSVFLSVDFIRSIVLGLSVQAGANLTNTYYDYVNGVDSKDTPFGEKTLVDKKVSASGLFILSMVCYAISIASIVPFLLPLAANSAPPDAKSLAIIFFVGLFLAYFYTAKPIGLKYIALGDLTIFACFGPLLMQGVSVLLTNATNPKLYLYCIPIGLLTEAILHVNNARDIKADTLAGAVTIATLLGHVNSYYFFIALVALSYLSVVYIALTGHWGCAFTLVTIPLALGIDGKYRKGQVAELPQETAQLHLPFGLLLFLGILFTDTGFLA